MSHLEDELAFQLQAVGAAEPLRNALFHPTRKFRFDFCWPAHRLAAEVEGGTGRRIRATKGPHAGQLVNAHHVSKEGYLSDCRKYNLALLLGWRVLRFTGAQVGSGEALKWIEYLLQPQPDRFEEHRKWVVAPQKRSSPSTSARRRSTENSSPSSSTTAAT